MTPPQFLEKCSDLAEIFPKQNLVRGQNDVTGAENWKFYRGLSKKFRIFFFKKMLQMSWNFDTRSKIRQKTQKKCLKIDLTSLWRHFSQFLPKIWRILIFIFYGGLSEKIQKNDVTMRKCFDFWTTNIFLQLLAKF